MRLAFGGRWLQRGLFAVTVPLAQVIGGQVTPLILAPIATAAAQHMGVDPRGMGIAVAMGASMALLSPRATRSTC